MVNLLMYLGGNNTKIEKSFAIAVILLFISVSVIPSTGTTDVKRITVPTSNGNTLYVGGSGPNNYTRIQDAIDDASDGDMVFVYDESSPYYEHLFVDKSINLIGQNKNTTIIDGGVSGDVVNVSADWVNISGFMIKNSSGYPHAGINIRSNNTIVNGNILTNNPGRGIYLRDSVDNIITKNNIANNGGCGISLGPSSEKSIVTENTITNNNCGIFLWKTSDNLVTENTIANNNLCGIGLQKTDNNTILGNTIYLNKESGIYFHLSDEITISGNSILNNQEDGMHLDGTDGSIISDNIILENRKGIYGISVDFTNIYNNTISNNFQEGIKFFYCDDNTIVNNTISNNSHGIELDDSTNNNIISDNSFFNDGLHISISSYQNTVTNNTVNGKPLVYLNEESNKVIDNAGQIILVDCDNIIVQDLDLSNTEAGIQLYHSDHCRISRNLFSNNELSNTSNTEVGIQLYHSDHCHISRNLFSNNEISIYLYYSSDNEIFQNNFINNSQRHIYLEIDYREVHRNKWNSNYFDDIIAFRPKIILCKVRTRFSLPNEPGYPPSPIYRPGFNIDWFPASEPYDIGV